METPVKKTPRTGHRRRKGQGHETREEILGAARTQFAHYGYEHTTTRRIAAAAGVTQPALYLYFPDKDAILLELCRGVFDRLVVLFDAIATSDDTPLARLRGAMTAYVRFGLEHPEEYKVAFIAKDRGLAPTDHRAVVDAKTTPGPHGAVLFAKFMALIEQCMQDGTVRPGDPFTTTECIWACGHGLVMLVGQHPHMPWTDRDTLIAAHIALVLDGLRPRRATP